MSSCVNCGGVAFLKCAGCVGAPEYRDGDSACIFYCGPECQKIDWPNHKKRCNNMKRRKSLLRAVKLLKATLLSYREVLYDWDLIEIEPRHDVLILKHDRKRPSWDKPIHFPDHLTSNIEHKEAALLKRMALDSLSILGPMTRTLLKGLVSRLETVNVKVKNPPYPAMMDPPDAAIFDMMDPGAHVVVLATLRNSDETWVVDVTECQFGFKGVLFPLQKYINEKYCTVFEPGRPYNHTETHDQAELIATVGVPPPKPMADIMRITRYRQHFATFVKKYVDNNMIEGSDAEFDTKMNEFSQKVKTHMSSCQS